MNKDKFEDYVSVGSHVATCGVEAVQELCVSLVASGSVKGEEEGEEDGEPEVESVLGLEKSYFELRSKVCTKQVSMKDFFSKK
jgi:hypothetical protein